MSSQQLEEVNRRIAELENEVQNIHDPLRGEKEWKLATLILHRDRLMCDHKRVSLDYEKRQVLCDLCVSILDPFDVLVRLSEDQKRHAELLKEFQQKEQEKQGRFYQALREKRFDDAEDLLLGPNGTV